MPIGALVLVSAGCLALALSLSTLPSRRTARDTSALAASPLAPERERRGYNDREVTLALAPPPAVGAPLLPQFTPPPLPTIEPRGAPAIGPHGEPGTAPSRVPSPRERRLQGGVDGLAGGARPRPATTVTRPAFGPTGPATNGSMPVDEPGEPVDRDGPASVRPGSMNGPYMGERTKGVSVSLTQNRTSDDGPPDRAGLDGQLQATRTRGARAAVLPSMTMMLARGRLFECTLDTAISSVIAGQVRCTLPLDVYGEDGRVVLLDRGSEIVGEYRSDLRRAQQRMGILWTRAKTPHGVLIDLDSPASDALGRAGVAGAIDTHFWERFGAAMMLSVLDDALAAVMRQSQASQNVFYGNTERAGRRLAEIALQDSINVPPTLVKNQGETVQVFLARDLDFRGIYGYRQLGVR